MENSTSGDKFVKGDKIVEKQKKQNIETTQDDGTKEEAERPKKDKDTHQPETHAATGNENHPGSYLFKNSRG